MAFPAGPSVNDTHTEGGTIYRWTGAAWTIEPAAGAANLAVANVTGTTLDVTSSTGTDATLPAATALLAGVQSAADKGKLDGIEAGATADQTAAEVVNTASGNLTSTNVQSALQELQTDIDALGALGGVYAGAGATFAGLPTQRADATGLQNGDTAILTVDDGGNQSGWYVWNGTAWTFVKEIPEALTIPAASETVSGTVELATTVEAAAGTDTQRAITPAGLAAGVAALEVTTSISNTGSLVAYDDEDAATTNLDLRIPASAALPGTDANERLHVLLGHATLPDGLYANNGTVWFQI